MLTGPAPALHGAGAMPRVFATLPDLFVLTRVVAGEAALLVRRADRLVRNGLEEDSSIRGRPGPQGPDRSDRPFDGGRAFAREPALHACWYPPDITNRIARETGAKLLVVPQSPGAVKGTEDYISHVEHLVGALADALK